jgi:uncharacterized protein YndB with AHSA1/START domain
MDLYATLAEPITAVFEHVADPSRLGDWLGELADVEAGATEPLGVVFALTLRRGERLVVATGELVAYEPPWLVAYRLRIEGSTHVVRVECTAGAGATRLHVHQADGDGALTIDLARLAGAVAAARTSGATGAEAWPATAPLTAAGEGVKEQIERKTGLSDGMEEQTMLPERIGTDKRRPTPGSTGGD